MTKEKIAAEFFKPKTQIFGRIDRLRTVKFSHTTTRHRPGLETGAINIQPAQALRIPTVAAPAYLVWSERSARGLGVEGRRKLVTSIVLVSLLYEACGNFQIWLRLELARGLSCERGTRSEMGEICVKPRLRAAIALAVVLRGFPGLAVEGTEGLIRGGECLLPAGGGMVDFSPSHAQPENQAIALELKIVTKQTRQNNPRLVAHPHRIHMMTGLFYTWYLVPEWRNKNSNIGVCMFAFDEGITDRQEAKPCHPLGCVVRRSAPLSVPPPLLARRGCPQSHPTHFGVKLC